MRESISLQTLIVDASLHIFYNYQTLGNEYTANKVPQKTNEYHKAMCCHTKLSKTSFNTPIDTVPPRFRHQELADDISSLCVKRDMQRVCPLTYYSFLATQYIFNFLLIPCPSKTCRRCLIRFFPRVFSRVRERR